jgi:hypothetical protein
MPDPIDLPSGRKFLRCFCSRQPVLAVYGLDSDGEPFVHMKSWKQHRVFCEAIFKGGIAKIFFRECIRWHIINIRSNPAQYRVETEKPTEL